MREADRQRVTEFVKELYVAGEIDADRLDSGVAGVLAARSEAELAEVVRSLPAPVPGLPRVRLDVTTNIGRVHLRHPGTPDRARRWPGGRSRQ